MTITVDDRELIEGMSVFADTMEGVNRYYMTSQTVHERKVLVRKAADRLQSLLSDRDRLEQRVRRLGDLLVKYGDSMRMANPANPEDQQLIDEVFGDD